MPHRADSYAYGHKAVPVFMSNDLFDTHAECSICHLPLTLIRQTNQPDQWRHPQRPRATTLDQAWARVERALPEGWDGPELKHESKFNGRDAVPLYGPERVWVAYAWMPERSGARADEGSTPIAALIALAEKLEGQNA